jgi:hypothetical protein
MMVVITETNLSILSVPNEAYSNLSILSVTDEVYSNLSILSVTEEVYSNLSILSVTGEVYSNLSILSVPDEVYSRNVSCSLNLISTFFFISTSHRDRHGSNRMIVGFTTPYAISAYPH